MIDSFLDPCLRLLVEFVITKSYSFQGKSRDLGIFVGLNIPEELIGLLEVHDGVVGVMEINFQLGKVLQSYSGSECDEIKSLSVIFRLV